MDYVRSVPYRYTEEQMEQRTMIGDRVFGEVHLLKVDYVYRYFLLCCCLEHVYWSGVGWYSGTERAFKGTGVHTTTT